jgi:hypothetical protein
MINAALCARAVAAGRIGLGVALMLRPARVTTPLLGRDAGRAGALVVSRGLAARDVALGAGALAASDAQLRPWVAAAVLADVTDLVATVAAGDSLPLAGRVLVGAVAASGAALGAIALAGLEPNGPSARS